MLYNNRNLLCYYCVNFNYLNSNIEFNSCSFAFQFFRKNHENIIYLYKTAQAFIIFGIIFSSN